MTSGPPRSPRTWLLLAVLLHGVVMLLLQPPWAGEDEPWHVEYALAAAAPRRAATPEELELLSPSQLALHRRTGAAPEVLVENQRRLLASMRRQGFWQRVDFAGWEFGATSLDHVFAGHTESSQPPLYYQAAGATLRALGIDDPEGALGVLRLGSLLAYVAVVALTLALARRLGAEEPVALLAAVFCAWLPLHARQAGLASNDVLARLLCALALYLAAGAVGEEHRRRRGAGAVALAGLALATKGSSIGAALAASTLGGGRALARASRRLRWAAALAVGAAVAVAAGVYWQLVGHAPAVPGVEELRIATGFVLSGDFGSELLRTLPGTYRWEGSPLPPGLQVTVAASIGLGLLACALAPGSRGVALSLCWLALALQLAAMVLRGFAVARYLLPVLPALAVLVSQGWCSHVPANRRRALVVALAAALVVLDGFALWSGLLRGEYLEVGS